MEDSFLTLNWLEEKIVYHQFLSLQEYLNKFYIIRIQQIAKKVIIF